MRFRPRALGSMPDRWCSRKVDYFGRTVNVAARIGEYARPGEVLVTKEVMDAADETSVTFIEIGPVELKGVSGPLRLHMARRGA
jgi:adenylate cyclase